MSAAPRFPKEAFHVPPPKPEHIEEFKRLSQKKFGTELSNEEALSSLTSLIVIVRYKHGQEWWKTVRGCESLPQRTCEEPTETSYDIQRVAQSRLLEMQATILFDDIAATVDEVSPNL